MSLEDQYDAWVRSVTGTGRHSATKQDRDAAQNSLNAMQAQLDALAESQKRQKSAADALNAVQRAGAATADSVRRMSSELTQSLRQDGLLGGKTAQPAPAAEPVKAGPENFNGLADRVRQQVLGQVLNAMGYTMEQYQQSPELKAQVDAAVELQVQTPAMQQTISENVTALMGTEEIQQKIDAATEQQVQLKIEETMASDEVQQKIMAATEQASAGAVQIRSLKQQLDQYNVFYMGLNSYTAGVDQAAAGAQRLQSNMPALLDGVKQLRDGAMQLSDGLKQFNEEGVEKLVSVLGDDVEGLAERLTATVEVSRNYRSFSGLTDGMDGAVRFIYRTEAVEKAE